MLIHDQPKILLRNSPIHLKIPDISTQKAWVLVRVWIFNFWGIDSYKRQFKKYLIFGYKFGYQIKNRKKDSNLIFFFLIF